MAKQRCFIIVRNYCIYLDPRLEPHTGHSPNMFTPLEVVVDEALTETRTGRLVLLAVSGVVATGEQTFLLFFLTSATKPSQATLHGRTFTHT